VERAEFQKFLERGVVAVADILTATELRLRFAHNLSQVLGTSFGTGLASVKGVFLVDCIRKHLCSARIQFPIMRPPSPNDIHGAGHRELAST
jgi:hypothetical protein